MNPLDMQGISIDRQLRSWSDLAVTPFDPATVDPYTRSRVALAAAVESEAVIFSHQFARHVDDPDVRRALALSRRVEHQQHTLVSCLTPSDQTPLETTIAYEQATVDLTAWVARHEPDRDLAQVFEFALVEDFDHLYRFADLYDLIDGHDAAALTGHLTEITPGRPTFMQHRHPHDDVRGHVLTHTVDPLTRMNVMTVLALEQKTMGFYMDHGPEFREPIARSLYAEIAMVEEQHVTEYASLLDPIESWFTQLVFHEFNEAYLYWSLSLGETDRRIRHVWEHHLEMEIGQLQEACRLLRRFDGIEPEEILPPRFPATPVTFEPNKHFVRQVLAAQYDRRADGFRYVTLDDLPADHRQFAYQHLVHDGEIPSETVIQMERVERRRDFRDETDGEHPIPELRPVGAGGVHR